MQRKHPKGQSAFEFISLTALGLIFMIVFIVIIGAVISERAGEERREHLFNLGYTLQEELLIAVTMQEGYSYDITIPESVGNFAYTITTQANGITLTSDDQIYSFPTPTLSGAFVVGQNTIHYNGSLTILQLP